MNSHGSAARSAAARFAAARSAAGALVATLAFADAFALAVPSADAQTIWTGLERPEGLQLEVHHPELDSFDFGGFSTVWFFGGRLAVRPDLNLVGEIPLAYADVSGLVGSSDIAIGAPYVGVERRHRNSLLEAGLRLPIASENLGTVVGALTEAVDRLGAFSSDPFVLTVAGTVGRSRRPEGGFTHRVRAGPRVLISTDGGGTELLVDYGGLIGYDARRFGVEGGVTGWLILTEEGEIGERTVHQAGFQLYTPLSEGGRIGALLRVPLDSDTSLDTDFTLGLIATIPLS